VEELDLVGDYDRHHSSARQRAIGSNPRLGRSRRELGDQLRPAHADRAVEVQLVTHPPADGVADLGTSAEQAVASGHIEKRLVERDRLDDRREFVKHAVQIGAHLSIAVMPSGQYHRRRAPAPRLGHRHGRTDASRSRLIRTGSHHAPEARPADDDGSAGQRRVVEHLDGCEEAVHVHVQDVENAVVGSLRVRPSVVAHVRWIRRKASA
jgi:hypothetical protein